jgi:hypothetical protein
MIRYPADSANIVLNSQSRVACRDSYIDPNTCLRPKQEIGLTVTYSFLIISAKQMSKGWLNVLDLWAVFLVTGAFFALATEVGVRVGKRELAKGMKLAESQIVTLESAVLGLLALLIGFTFAMALSRYDTRRELVIAEVDTIGTSYLRARLLPAPHNEEVSRLLQQYIDARLKFYSAGIDDARLSEADNEAEKLQEQIWLHAIETSAKDPQAETVGLFIESVNEMIALQSRWLNAVREHVPQTVFLILYIVAAIGFGFVGYACGRSRTRHLFVTLILATLISIVITLIVDLDRPRRGLIKVSEQGLIDLKQSIDKAK